MIGLFAPLSAHRGTASRRLFWIGFFGLILAGWVLMFRLTVSPLPGVSARDYWAALCVSAAGAPFGTLAAMWALMSAAMMLPTFVPALRVFAELGAVKATNGRTLAVLALGYGAVWLAFAPLAAALQVALARGGATLQAGSPLGGWVQVALMAAAGAYQFAPVKAACLAKCRHPLIFFMEHWRPGAAAAFGMGARLGLWCLGCCWVLMLMGFAGGAMNLMWMGAATLFMTFEKLPEIGRHLTKPAGLVLLVAAAGGALNLATWGG